MPATEEPVMTWGKYRGIPLSQVPGDYLKWCLEALPGMHPDTRSMMEAELSRRGSGQSEPERPSTCQDEEEEATQQNASQSKLTDSQLLLILRVWKVKSLKDHHPDRGATDEAFVAVNRVVESLLSALATMGLEIK